MAESTLELTKAEKNFYVLCMINTKVVPLAVRYCFDGLVSPTDLSNQINQNARKLQDLVSKKVISIEQENILLRVPKTTLNIGATLPTPARKATTSMDFDVTLMICLLRNFGLVAEPATGWDKLPLEADESKGADLVRIKIFRNQIAHSPTNEIKENRFNKMFKRLSKAIKNLSDDTLSSDVDEIFKFDFDGSSNVTLQKLKNDISELRSEYEKTTLRTTECEKRLFQLQKESRDRGQLTFCQTGNLPKNLSENYNKLISRWKEDDNKFVSTRGTSAVWKEIQKHNAVMVIGNSGSGKTATARHVALKLHAMGYEIIPIELPVELLNYRNNKRKQVFVLNDFVGKYKVDTRILNIWSRFDEESKILFHCEDIKIISSVRKQIFKNQDFIGNEMFLSEHVVDLDDPCLELSEKEKRCILLQHLKTYSEERQIDENETKAICKYSLAFPLLCQLFTRNLSYFQKGSAFFKNPFYVLKQEFTRLFQKNKPLYCGLVLCMIFKENVNDLLDVTKTMDLHGSLAMVLETCEVSKKKSRKTILENIRSMIGIYLVEESNTLNFIHDAVYESLSCHFCTNSFNVMLKCCDSSFIRDRIWVQSKIPEDDENIVIVPIDRYSVLADRIFSELKSGKYYNVLVSQPMKDENFVKYLADTIDKSDISKHQLLRLPHSETHSSILMSNWKKTHVSKITELSRDALMEVIQNDKTNTLLHWTVATGCYYFLTYLLETTKSNDFLKLLKSICEDEFSTQSLFHLAVLAGNTKTTEYLILKGAMVNEYDVYGIPALNKVASTDKIDMAELLISRGADVNKAEEFMEWTPCFLSVWFNKIPMLEFLLLHGADPNYGDTFLRTPLFLAVSKNNIHAVELLLKHGAIINIKNFLYERLHGDNALLNEAINNNNKDLAELLLKYGLEVTHLTTRFPSFPSFKLHRREMLFCILDHERKHILTTGCNCFKYCDVNEITRNGWRAIHFAVRNNDIKALQNLCNFLGEKPKISIFGQQVPENMGKLLWKSLMIENQSNRLGMSPLHIAAVCNNIEAAKLLLQKGASLMLRDKCGRTPLHLVNDEQMAKLFLTNFQERKSVLDEPTISLIVSNLRIFSKVWERQSNSLLNMQDKNGNTPLHSVITDFSCVDKALDVVDVLVSRGADTRIRNIGGFLPSELFQTLQPYFENRESRINNLLKTKSTKKYEQKEKVCLFTFCSIFLLLAILFWLGSYFMILYSWFDNCKDCSSVYHSADNVNTEDRCVLCDYQNRHDAVYLIQMRCLSFFLMHLFCVHFSGLKNILQTFYLFTLPRSKRYVHNTELLFSRFTLFIKIVIMILIAVEDRQHAHLGFVIFNTYILYVAIVSLFLEFEFTFTVKLRYITFSKALLLCSVCVWVYIARYDVLRYIIYFIMKVSPFNFESDDIQERSMCHQIKDYGLISFFMGIILKIISFVFYLLFCRSLQLFYCVLYQPFFWYRFSAVIFVNRMLVIFIVLDLLIGTVFLCVRVYF